MYDDGDGAAEASSFPLVSTNVQINTSDIERLAVVLICSTGTNRSTVCSTAVIKGYPVARPLQPVIIDLIFGT